MNKNLAFFLAVITLLAVANGSTRNLQGTSTDTIQSVRATIAQKIQSLETLATQRAQAISGVNTKGNQLKLIESELIQARVAAETSYKNYFNQKNRCDGLVADNSGVDKLAKIPEGSDACLKAPLGPEALQLSLQKSQLSSFAIDTYIASQVLDEQNQYLTNANTVYEAYLILARYYNDKRFESRGLLTQCLYQHNASSTSPPPQCKDEQDAATYYSLAYAQYNTKRVLLQNSLYLQKTAVLSTKNQQFTNAETIQKQNQASLTSAQALLKSVHDICIQNAELLKTQANQNLAAFQEVQTRYQSKKSQIQSGFASIEAELAKIGQQLNVLAAKLVELQKQKQ